MSEDTEIVINLDAKRIFAIILILGITIFSVSGYISALLAFARAGLSRNSSTLGYVYLNN